MMESLRPTQKLMMGTVFVRGDDVLCKKKIVTEYHFEKDQWACIRRSRQSPFGVSGSKSLVDKIAFGPQITRDFQMNCLDSAGLNAAELNLPDFIVVT